MIKIRPTNDQPIIPPFAAGHVWLRDIGVSNMFIAANLFGRDSEKTLYQYESTHCE